MCALCPYSPILPSGKAANVNRTIELTMTGSKDTVFTQRIARKPARSIDLPVLGHAPPMCFTFAGFLRYLSL
jgi:hypothetical protein